jgi:hypothetical protein
MVRHQFDQSHEPDGAPGEWVVDLSTNRVVRKTLADLGRAPASHSIGEPRIGRESRPRETWRAPR